MKFLIPFMLIILATGSCAKDDSFEPEAIVEVKPDSENSENQPPATFDLISVAQNANGVAVLPSFGWQKSADPEGDSITYDLYLDKNSDPTTVFASDLTTESFEVLDPLHLLTDYYWKVDAIDAKNARTTSNIFKFTTRGLNVPNTATVTSANFPVRYWHTTTVFDEKLWVIGGSFGNGRGNDVWYSNDGIDWVQATPSAPFTARQIHTTTVFDNKLWVIAGNDGDAQKDIWYSGDGVNWTEVVPDHHFSKRLGHATVVFKGKLWVMGGLSGGEVKNDVWNSDDGLNWNEVTITTPFPARDRFTMEVFNDKLWIIAGNDHGDIKNDVWYSSDGASWTEATATAAFSKRSVQSTAVFDNKLWLFGGWDGEPKNDIWYSEDGISWFEQTATAPFSARFAHTTTVFNDKIWLIGGKEDTGLYFNDIWVMD